MAPGYSAGIKSPSDIPANERLAESLATSGLRFTRHREHIYQIVAQSADHPTAEEVFSRARQSMPDVSVATVYNCLSVLVSCGLVKQVILDRSPARFCPNMREHYHFYCERCGEVTDIHASSGREPDFSVPSGFKVHHAEIALRGLCAKCAAQ